MNEALLRGMYSKARSTEDGHAYQFRWLGINNELVLLQILCANS